MYYLIRDWGCDGDMCFMTYVLWAAFTIVLFACLLSFGTLSAYCVRQYNKMVQALGEEGTDARKAVTKFCECFAAVFGVKLLISVFILYWLIHEGFEVFLNPSLAVIGILI